MKPLVAVIMGSKSDQDTMSECTNLLKKFNIPYKAKVVSAHRMPDEMFRFAAGARDEGFQVIIAGAGGAAHLPGMTASKTTLPVIGVPVKSGFNDGLDSLLSIAQMPGGIPVATMSVGKAGAKNAAILAARILSLGHPEYEKALKEYEKELYELADQPLPEENQS